LERFDPLVFLFVFHSITHTIKNNVVIRIQLIMNRVDGVMVSMLATIVVDPELTPSSGQTKDYEIGICCFYAITTQQ
jgi:hypothetical protein